MSRQNVIEHSRQSQLLANLTFMGLKGLAGMSRSHEFSILPIWNNIRNHTLPCQNAESAQRLQFSAAAGDSAKEWE